MHWPCKRGCVSHCTGWCHTSPGTAEASSAPAEDKCCSCTARRCKKEQVDLLSGLVSSAVGLLFSGRPTLVVPWLLQSVALCSCPALRDLRCPETQGGLGAGQLPSGFSWSFWTWRSVCSHGRCQDAWRMCAVSRKKKTLYFCKEVNITMYLP